MVDKNMTDNEIIKALECEANEKVCIHEQYEQACGLWCKHYHKWCADMSGKNNKNNCSAFKPNAPTKRAKAILDLINRQKAEIERLEEDSKRLKKVQMQLDDAMKMYNVIKSEAYKEFAERLKEIFPNNNHWVRPREIIDNLLKEMVGED